MRGPANHCGLFGIRPSHGRVSLEGCLALAPSFDTCGYFARDAATFEKVSAVLLGDDPAPLPATPRLLLAADAFAMVDVEVRAVLAPVVKAIEGALGQAGLVETAPEGFEPLYWAHRRLQGREAWGSFGAMIERYRPPLGPGIADRFEFARLVTYAEVAEAEEVRERFATPFRGLIGTDAVMLLPTMPDIAPLLSRARGGAQRLPQPRHQPPVPVRPLRRAAGRDAADAAQRRAAGLSLLGPRGSDFGLVRLAARLAGERIGPA